MNSMGQKMMFKLAKKKIEPNPSLNTESFGFSPASPLLREAHLEWATKT